MTEVQQHVFIELLGILQEAKKKNLTTTKTETTFSYDHLY